MQKRGQLDMHFEVLEDGVFYSRVDLELDGETRSIRLPRYHSMIGWVEVFGLPPQFEWLVLADIDAFKSQATLEIDGTTFAEHFSYDPRPEASQHHITVTRNGEAVHEKVSFVEDYTNAPEEITATVSIEHSDGRFVCEITKSLHSIDTLSADMRELATDVIAERGTPDQIWTKSFKSSGEKPPIYYGHFFPELAGVDVVNTSGFSLEIGYFMSGDIVAAAHGDWYKWFRFGGHRFYIYESNFSSTTIDTPEGKQTIKDTYRKELFSED